MMATGQGFIDSCHERRQGLTGRRVQKPVPMMPLDLPDLPESWTWTSLSSLCERVSVGHVGPTSEFFCEPPSGIPFIRSQDVRPGKLTLANVAHVVESFHDKLKKSQLKSGDILIVRVGANRGDCCVVPDGVGSLNCANIVFARPLMPNPFLGFYFNSDFGQSLLGSLTTGSAQGVLNTQSIATIPVPVPPVSLQRKIASILSAYDDLIENNTRRIAILEEMAQAIYREWFVNFRFPGHENVKLVDSPLGQIPEGWVAGVVNDLLKLLSGFAFKSKTFVDDGGYKVVTIKHVHDGEFQTNSMSLLDSPPDRMPAHCHLETADVLMSLTGNIGRTCLVFGESFLLNQRVAKLHPHRPQDRPLVYWMFRSLDTRQRLEQIANGVAQQNLSPVQTGKMEVPIPPVELRDSYAEVASPMVEAILNLNRKNANLRTTRDLLLPKLISGKLDVEDLDIDVGMTAEALEEATA